MTRQPPDEFVTISRYGHVWQARLACAALEADGLDVMLVGENHAALNWTHAQALGIRLRVRARDAARAAEVLRIEEELPAQNPAASCSLRKWSFVGLMEPVALLLGNLLRAASALGRIFRRGGKV